MERGHHKRFCYWSLVLFLLSKEIVLAQTTNATCQSTTTNQWLFNPAGESPCAVWSKIQSLCLSSSSYINVPPLHDSSWSYNFPTSESSDCLCNVVSYGLMAGCSWCQWEEASLPDEKSWSGGCSNYEGKGLGFAENVENIPGWAYKTWDGGTWDPSAAQSATVPPSEPSYTTTRSRSFPADSSTSSNPSTSATSVQTGSGQNNTTQESNSSSTSTSKPGSSNSNSKDSASKTPWGAIVGGIAGGIIGVVLLFLLFRWYRNRNKAPNPYSPTASSLDVRSIGKKKNKRIKYPYPRESLTAGRNFLDMLVGKDGEDKKKRDTEMLGDPEAFETPRKAPKAPISSTEKWKTTSQRLAEESSDDDDWSEHDGDSENRYRRSTWVSSFMPSHRAEKEDGEGSYLTTSQRLSKQRNSSVSDTLESVHSTPPSPKRISLRRQQPHIPPQRPPPAHLPPPVPNEVDFSQPPSIRPTSENTLPSFYELPTGARTYESRGSTMYSIASKNPTGMHNKKGGGRPVSESTIGAALGSGVGPGWTKGDRWSGESAPALPIPKR
ncbi:uncharacterized protein L203_101207 [Cryptococcus depauperatus CBS 7841]|uniref:Mid2 domain-containing protein n=1 Tax=Cryptococcus depauperatus CBS 7841 TaxID=1295531 RepID=A0AAJ8JPI4_9TREE